ncbi:hypothetical protein GCM10009120_32030 [Sphingobacterium siyangense subsp. cladoniae]
MLTGFGHSSIVKIARLVEIIVVHFLKNVVQKFLPNNNLIPKGYFTSLDIIITFANTPDQSTLR